MKRIKPYLKLSNLKYVGYAVLVVYGIIRLFKSFKNNTTAQMNNTETGFHNLVFPMTIRNDSQGQGAFGTPRSKGHQHQGVDYEVYEGQEVYAPFAGQITRLAYPYGMANGNAQWKGLVMVSTDKTMELKLFYCSSDKVGQNVLRGQRIAFAQAISKKFSPKMIDHIHAELRINGKLVDISKQYQNAV